MRYVLRLNVATALASVILLFMICKNTAEFIIYGIAIVLLTTMAYSAGVREERWVQQEKTKLQQKAKDPHEGIFG